MLCTWWLILINASCVICISFNYQRIPESAMNSGFRPIRKFAKKAKTFFTGYPLPSHAESNMSTIQIIANRGYESETHTVTTADGYILELHRIPRARGEPVPPQTTTTLTRSPKHPVFLQHGILDSSATWVLNPTHRSLGYDVWLGNLRGNTYSVGHENHQLNPNKTSFWRFSWDEMGQYDVPAFINYVLGVTNREKLTYIGHSMGCSVFFIAMIKYPQLNLQIDTMVALAPATSLATIKSPVRLLAPWVGIIQWITEILQFRALFPNDGLTRAIQKIFCQGFLSRSVFCRNIMFNLVGADASNLEPEFIPIIDGHYPAGTSVRTAAQFAQNYNSGQSFIAYNHGRRGNINKYGMPLPPPYDLSQVMTPVHIFYGENDHLVTPSDVRWLADRLGNLQSSNRVEDDQFNHIDFTWAKKAKELVYDRIVPFLPETQAYTISTPGEATTFETTTTIETATCHNKNNFTN